ncbi:hypothetical protein TRFO_17524 [Tritrichomonas foetus]|uniref:Uncharacterized protein n=1 Tax=Tritrichomonas foetus TaxID=1144522 RepID=A0A1J4KSN9_9EUKA|nr:hypothetical protein TRFO_17524 [Tritrichomonas foetus]|eukprot:OHT12678.1 hypothetical protein TRFO_17524 [Tritrichomonas foetus]
MEKIEKNAIMKPKEIIDIHLNNLILSKKRPSTFEEIGENEGYYDKENIQQQIGLLLGESDFKLVALLDINLAIQCNPKCFKDYFTVEMLQCILPLLHDSQLFDHLIIFLGLLTYYYPQYSLPMANNDFFHFILNLLSSNSINEQYITNCFTLLANILTDIQELPFELDNSFSDVLLNIRKENLCSEYFRLISVLANNPNFSPKESTNFMKIVANCVCDSSFYPFLYCCLENLISFLKGKRAVTASYIILPITKNIINIILKCQDLRIIIKCLELIQISLKTIPDYYLTLIDLDFCDFLKNALEIDNPEVSYLIFQIANAYIRNNPEFGEYEAQILASVDVNSIFEDSSFDIKIEIIDFINRILSFLKYEYLTTISSSTIESICDLINTDNEYHKLKCYDFILLVLMITQNREKVETTVDILLSCDILNQIEEDKLTSNIEIQQKAKDIQNLFTEIGVETET